MKPEDKETIQQEVVNRVLEKYSSDPVTIEQTLFDTLYEERRRLKSETNRKLAAQQNKFYHRVQRAALHSGPDGQRSQLKAVIRFFTEEVTGHFDPRVYHLATKAIPVALNLLLNALSPLNLIQQGGNLAKLDDRLFISGEIDAFRRAANGGTIILVPTHSSNLDSLLVGYMIYRLGLPPFIYGAGLNLFSNKLISYFMHNLGAYKIDRRKKTVLYKDVLKNYASATLEHGYHTLFFPGGTRSRSGAVEQKLKLGLLSQGLNAYIHNLMANKAQPDIFVVPCTINYQLVLEAETLIDDHLQEVGKSRYIIEDDEFTKPKRILDFSNQVFSQESRIHLVLSHPLDVFGNPISPTRHSLDDQGRDVDRKRFVTIQGQPGFDEQRDKAYTLKLAESIVRAYARDTVVSPIHLLASTVFAWLEERNPHIDLYRLLRTGGQEESMPLVECYQRLERTLARMRSMDQAGKLRLADSLKTRDTVKLVSQGLTHLNSYHQRPALQRRGDRLFHLDRNLLLYYQNRLRPLLTGEEATA